MKRLISLLALLSTAHAEDFVYTTTFSNHSPAPILPGFDTSIGTLDEIQYSISGHVYGLFQSAQPILNVDFNLRDEIFLNNTLVGISSTTTPYLFSTPTTTLFINGDFQVNTTITSGFESFYSPQTVTLIMFMDGYINNTNPHTFVPGGLQGFYGSETITYVDASVVPEPSAIALLGLAMGILLIWYGRRKRLQNDLSFIPFRSSSEYHV